MLMERGFWMGRCLYQHVLEVFLHLQKSPVLRIKNFNLANFVSDLMQGKILLSKKDRQSSTKYLLILIME